MSDPTAPEATTAPPSVPVAFSGPDVSQAGLSKSPDDKPVSFVLHKGVLQGSGVATHTCPQCGLNPAGAPKKRAFQWVPPWVYLGLLVNILVLLLLIHFGRKRIETRVTLCDDCDRADRRGRTFRALSVVGAVLAPVALLILGAALDSAPVAGFGGGIGLVAGIVGSVVVHRKTRGDVILCLKIDEQQLTLKAAPAWRRVLAAEQPDLLLG